MIEEYYLPDTTAQLLKLDRLKNCKNLGLLLDKYPTRAAIGKWPNPNRPEVGKTGSARTDWFKDALSNNHIDAQLTKQVLTRWKNMLKAIKARQFTATTDWRMVVGLGGGTILETDMALHHLYGIPFIPGSALKGLARAYVTGEIHQSTKIEEDNPLVKQIFGTQQEAGSVIFLDAMPESDKIVIELDIMNAHYPDYYGKNELPTNDQSPNPVTFLTVAKTSFLFALAPRRPKDNNDVTLAMEWLQTALQHYGVGGKTSAGYGYFSIPSQEKKAEPPPYIRPNIPTFTVGQKITKYSTRVVAPTEELRRIAPEAKAYLRCGEFSVKDVLVVIEAEEAASWSQEQTKTCLFVREEEREGFTVLFCMPGSSKKKKNSKA